MNSAAWKAKCRKARRALIESRIIAQEPNSPQALVARARNRVREHRNSLEDMGRLMIEEADKKANKHADRLVQLTIRALALYDAITVANRKFEEADLSDIKLDTNAQQSIKRSIDKLMQVAIFSMVSKEIIDDRALRKMIVDMETRGRFMRGAVLPPAKDDTEKGQPNKQQVMMNALRMAIDSF